MLLARSPAVTRIVRRSCSLCSQPGRHHRQWASCLPEAVRRLNPARTYASKRRHSLIYMITCLQWQRPVGGITLFPNICFSCSMWYGSPLTPQSQRAATSSATWNLGVRAEGKVSLCLYLTFPRHLLNLLHQPTTRLFSRPRAQSFCTVDKYSGSTAKRGIKMAITEPSRSYEVLQLSIFRLAASVAWTVYRNLISQNVPCHERQNLK